MSKPGFGAPLAPSFYDRPITHRGLHNRDAGVIENSLSAFRAAIAHGYGIELDVQVTADDEALVFHDYQLDRLTDEAGFVRQRSAREMGEIRLSGADEAAPTLQEVLDLVRGQVPLLIEIKDPSMQCRPTDGAVERRIAECLKGYHGAVALMSFSPYSVAHCRDAAPEWPRGRTTCDFNETDWAFLTDAKRSELAALSDLEELGACFISHDKSDLSSEAVGRVKAAGLPVFCWTIKSAEEERIARQWADNVTFESYIA